MGRSPGKWIKTVLFGKKATRSHSSSKARDAAKTGNVEGYLGGKGPSALAVNSPVISEPVVTSSDRSGILRETEQGMPSNIVNDEEFVIPAHQDSDTLGLLGSTMPNDPERLMEGQAAVKVQAAVRGYLARRAFLTLKGIIRLQALVRGHLVRRQAVSTLRAVRALVKLQALVRGWKIRCSGMGFEANGRICKENTGNAKPVGTWEEKLLANVFVSRLLSSLPAALSLEIQYSEGEPNSALIWMERWTSYGIWKPVPPAKKPVDFKPQTKRTNYSMETESGRPKRISKRTSTTYIEHGLNNSCSEPEKPKRNPRKNPSSAVDSVQEHPQIELERVKRNLRKVSNLTAEASDRADLETEKPTRSLRKASSTPEILEQVVEESTEKPRKDISPVPERKPDIEVATQKSLAAEGLEDVLIDSSPAVEVSQLDDSIKEENISAMNGHMSSKEEETCDENQKTSKKRSAFPTKLENAENGSPNTPTLPSYMAATESAKAKLRSQNSLRLGSDSDDKNGFTRRHSLPSSTNVKLNSHSPRTQKLVQAGGVKGGLRSDRSLLSSRDANERPIQVEWRR